MVKHEYDVDGSLKRVYIEDGDDDLPEGPRPLRKLADGGRDSGADDLLDANDLARELLGDVQRDISAPRAANLPPVDPELQDLLGDSPA